MKNYNYGFVANSIGEMLTHPLDRSLQDKLIEARAVCESFDLWDKFDHKRALELIEPYGSKYYPYIIDLKKILGKSKASGYELVSDLLNNADRRAAQLHYDDAIARLYRAIELFAQIRLEKLIYLWRSRHCSSGRRGLSFCEKQVEWIHHARD